MHNQPSPKRILVVEDDEVNLMIAEHILQKAGYEVRSVNNGEAAIDAVRAERFDMILMDIEMPIMSGLEATPHIRTLTEDTPLPIIALTAHSLPEKLAQISEAGLDGYILKPFDGDKFSEIAGPFLNAKQD